MSVGGRRGGLSLWGMVLLTGTLLMVGTGMATANDKYGQRLKMELRHASPGEQLDVIIRFTEKADLSPLSQMTAQQRRLALRPLLERHAQVTYGPLIRYLEAHGASHFKTLWLSNSLGVRVPVSLLPRIAERDDVQGINLDATVRLPDPPAGMTPEQASRFFK